MKTVRSLAVIFSIGMLALGCRKQPLDHMTDEESRIYITDHDSTINYNAYHTFSISDSIALIQNGSATKILSDAGTAYVNAVKDAMEANGYTLVAKDANPDLGITVNRIVSTSTGVISNGSYWDDYSYYWDPYYWGYPGYGYYLPYSYSVYQIREGAVSIDMVDLMNASKDGKLNVIWTGLIRGSGIYSADVAASQVQALFAQSPYLKTP